MYKIVEKKVIGDGMILMSIEAMDIALKAKPGQFVILRADTYGERIPLTIADSSAKQGIVTIIFQIVGATTKLLSGYNAGDSILDLVGPLGCPTELEGTKRACVIGGGAGVAIAYPQAKALHSMGVHTDVIIGFRNRDMVILEDELKAVSTNLYVTTDDGSYGEKGLVTEKLLKLIEAGANYDLVIAIGPVPMMKYVCKTTAPFQIKTIVSLNPIMIDGTGMCGGCRVSVGGKIKFACVDGPDFDGHQVDFDQLMTRNKFYASQEKEAAGHACRIGLGGNCNA